ncbi:MAG: aminopeptidase P N-terminal domain-containing protein [Fimbriimonas sp.]
MLKHLCLASLLVGSAGFAFVQQGQVKYPVFEADNLPASLYARRRDSIKQQLGPNTLAILFTNPERNRSNDTDYRFRPDSNFRYLTGFEEPDSALLLAPSGVEYRGKKVTEILFVNTSDAMSETWLGYRMGPADAMTLQQVELALPNSKFQEVLKSIVLAPSTSLMLASAPADPSGPVAQMLKQWNEWVAGTGKSPATARLGTMLSKMRVKKSPEEVVLLQKAVDATVAGHREAMKSLEPGMREFEIQAVVEYAFTRMGCEAVGYNSIVGSGPNSCILHYEANRRQAKAGDILCMDVAGEYHGYSADVTRSFPVSGKFTPAQRDVYELVLAAQEAGIRECVIGKPFGAADAAARKIVADGLLKLGITKTADESRRYFMHGTSHYIGLDVHDAHGDNTLQENYALTVEPGIYIKAGSPCDPKWWNIGVRIEDDILVTKSGPVNMSAGVPRRVDEVEALMREKGIGNIPVGK